MRISATIGEQIRTAFCGGLLGVLLFILMPRNAFAFQVDSLQQVQSLDGLAQSILKFGDYDGDGDLDLIIAGTNSSSTPTTKLYKNTNGTFTEDTNSSITGFNYPGLSWGDIDGDGDLDFAISGNTSTGFQAKLYLNDGSAVFTEASSDPFYDAYWGNMELGDLDNDGDLDVFQTGLQSNGQRVAEIFWNDGSGNFTIDTNNSFTGTGDGETPLADVDNDGDLDILLSGYIDAGGNITQVHLNDGTGNFSLSQSLQGVASNGMDFGDYDNDGDLDLILTGLDYNASARRAYIYENDGTGNFAIDATNTIASASSSNAKWGDYDHDGDLDLIVSGFSDDSIRETYIYTNNGTGSMTYTSNGAITGSEEGYVDWADLDGDGFLEVAITGWDGSTRMTKIYQNIRMQANAVPTAPTNLQATVLGDSVSFSWNAATDTDGGPLSYALFYHNSDSSKYIIPAFSDTTNGFRRVNGFRNLGMTTTHKIAKTNIPYGSFSWGVQAIDGAGKPSAFSKSTVNIQPQTPTNLNALRNELSVDLTWTANTTDSVEYYVIYKEDNNSGQIDSIATSSTNSFTYSGLNYGNTYDFYVAARTTAGVKSDRSDSVEIVVPSLDAPSGLTFTRNELSVDLEWNSVQGVSVDYYIIYKEDNNSGQVDSLGFSSDTTFTFSGLSYGNTYDFYVAAKTTAGVISDRSDSVEIVVPTLNAPSGLTFTRNELSVDLEWNSVQGVSVDYYIIYRELNNSGQIDSLGFSSNISFTYTGLDYGNTYDFYVAAKTTAGVTSDRSDSVEFVVPSLNAPQNLQFTRNKLSVDLSWQSVNNVSVDYYVIYKEEDNSGQIDSLGFSNDTTFTYAGLDYSKIYDFYVATRTTSGKLSNRSDSVEFEMPAVGVFSLDAVDSTGFQKVGTFNGITHFDFADYDLDGDFDMLAVGYDTLSGFQLKVFDNDGEGNFSNSNFSVSQIDGSDPELTSVKWVDANLDNLPDIFFNGFNGGGTNTKLYLSNGDGTFNDSNLDLINTYSKDAYLWMDFDTDGDDDLLLYGNELSGSSAIRLYLNDGYGNLAVEDSTLFTTNYGVEGGDRYPVVFPPFEMFDYDNDRDKDLVALTEGTFTISIFENQGGLNFVKDNTVPFDAINAEVIEIADVNNDGYMDIMFAGNDNSENPKTQLYLNNSTGNSYSSGLIKYTGFTFPGLTDSDIKIRDLNNNNAAVEFILAGDSAGVPVTRVYSNLVEETGVFEIGKSVYFENGELLGLKDANIRILDLDNDNDLDVFINGNVLPNQSGDYTGRVYYYKNTTASNIPAIDNTVVYAPSASIVNDSLKIGDLPSYSNYSFYLYNTDLSKYFITPKANTVTGFRTIPDRAQVEFYLHGGNYDTDLELSHKFERKNFPGGTYTLGVQGIRKESRIGGAFKTTTVKFGPLAPQNVVSNVDSANFAVTLTWSQNPGTNTDKYVIYQTFDTLLTASAYDLNTYDYSAITVGETTDTTFTVNSVPANKNLYYYVAAFTNDNSISPQFSELSEVDSVLITTEPFEETTNSITGVVLGATTWGDYDDDGDLDVVVTGTTGNGNVGAIAELWDNDGSGNFSKNTSVSSTLVGAYRSGAAFGDYDNDGFLDLVIIGYNTSNVGTTTLYHNEGDGTFSVVSNTGFGNGAWASASWGDYNNDGFLDLFIGGLSGSGTRFNIIYENNGDGTFSDANAGFLGSAGGDFVHADYDNDGDLDVALAGYTNSGNAQSKFYRNDNGTYNEVSGISSLLLANDNATMEWGDFDNDGDLDMFNAGGGSAKILLNDGSGGLSESGLSFTGVSSGSADWTDYDLDGDLDLFYSGNNGGSQSYLYENNGDGTFTENTTLDFTVAETGTVDWVDVDNDGDADLFVTGNLGTGATNSILYRNFITNTNSAPSTPINLSHTFSTNKLTLNWDSATDSEGGPISYSLYLVNDDSTGYLISPESNVSNGYRRTIGLGNSGITNSQTFNFPFPPNGNFTWYLQAIDAAGLTSGFASASFTETNTYVSPQIPENVTTTIGNLEVTLSWDSNTQEYFETFKIYQENDSTVVPSNVIANISDTSYSVTGLLFETDYHYYISAVDSFGVESALSVRQDVFFEGSFSVKDDSTLTGVRFGATAWGDYDNDGDLDVVITGTTNGGNNGAIAELYDNDGSGNFTKNTAVSSTLIEAYRSGADFGDYDNDGFLDLIIIGYNSSGTGTTTLYHNNGDGTFSSVNNTGFTNGAWASAAWADYNNDGYLDVLLGGIPSSGPRFNTIYRNNGDGTFSDANAGILGSAGGDFVFADYDNDGDLDVGIAGMTDAGYAQSRFYRNDAGTFNEVSTVSLYANDNATMEWSDFDNDGDLDLFNSGNASAQILINDGNGSLTNSGISLTGVWDGAADWNDYDLDGDLDLMYIGNNGGPLHNFYQNNGDGSFTKVTTIPFENLTLGTVDFVDIDNDGDADAVNIGFDGGSSKAIIYNNKAENFAGSNTPPTIPNSLTQSISQNEVTLSWTPSTDAEGGPITYSVYLVNDDSSGFMLSPESDTTNGYRKVIGMGNSERTTSHVFNFPTPPNGDFSWFVQAVDAAGLTSDFVGSSFSLNTTYTSPEIPSNITSTINERAVTFSWDSVAQDYFGSFNIYQETDSSSSPSNLIASLTDTSYTVSGLSYDTNYYFYITNKDLFDQESDPAIRQDIFIQGNLTLQNDTTFTGVHLGATAWGDYDNDGDLDLVITGTTNGGNSGAIAELYDNDGSGNFTKNTAVSDTLVGAYRSGAAFGDYDNDGYNDLVIIGYNSSGTGTTSLYKNNGDGTFSTINNTGFEGGGWASASWGDYNNDGLIDLLIGGLPSSGTRFNTIYKNNGDGTFSDANAGFVGTAGGSFTAADYDNDGDLDVVLSGRGNFGGDVGKFYKNVNGSFIENEVLSQQLFFSDNAFFKWVDYDDDGDFDLFMTGNGATRMLINDGSGGLSNSGLSFSSVYQGAADFSDYDFDGDMDVFYSGNFGGRQAYFYESDGDGTFTSNTNYDFPKTEQGTNDWVDVDNDGKPELFITGISSSGDRIATLYENITSGSNSTPSTPTNLTTTVGDGITTFSWDPSSDVEGSGISYNVFVYNQDSTTAVTPFDSDTTSGVRRLIEMGNAGIDTSYSILMNTGNYRWGVQAVDATGSSSTFSKTSTSITIQAAVDSISSTVDGTSVTLTWIPADGTIDFYTVYKINESAVSDSIGTISDTTFTISNLDRDETFYFSVKATSSAGITSTFSPLASAFIDPYYSEVSILSSNPGSSEQYSSFADTDNDDDFDLIIAGSNLYPRFYQNTLNDTLLYSSDISSDFEEFTNSGAVISFADYDNDADLDVLISGNRYISGYIFSSILYKNNGNNDFTNVGAGLVGISNGVHAWGDYDNDGDLDLFLGGYKYGWDGESKLYENKNGSFIADSVTSFPNGRTFDAEWGDIDNDRDIDLVICNENETSIFRNNGQGGLIKDPTTLQYLGYDCSLSMADYDNDKDLDLLVFGTASYYSTPQTILYKNDGSGTFSNSGNSFSNIASGDSDWGDFDLDGDLDILISGYTSLYYGWSTTKIYINDGIDSFSEITIATSNGAENGAINFVDIDNDQDLDIFLSGSSGARYFKNAVNTTISAPASPSNIQHRLYADTLRISWDPSSDANSEPITYEVMVALNDTGLVTPLSSDSSNGTRRLRQRGNAEFNNSFDIIGLNTGTYKVGIQSINGASIASEFELSEAKVGSYVDFSDSLFYMDTDSVLVFNPLVYHPSGDSSFTFSLKSGDGGTVFIDENNNNVVDAGEALSQGQTYYYADIQSDSIKYVSSVGRYDESPLNFSSIIYPGSATPSILTLDQTPSISGTADQGGWYLLSNSMDTPVGTYLENVWTQGAVNADTDTGTPNLYTFSQDSAKYIPLTTDLDTTKLAAGTGLLAYLFPDDNYNDSEGPVDGGWPKELSNFGNPFDNSVEIPVRNVDVDGSSTTTGSEGFALLGNPYPFTISVDSLVTELVDVDAFANRYVYLWDPINKRYELKLNGSIDPYTSFFVRTVQSGNTGNVNLQYSDYYAEVAPKIAPNVEFEFTLTHKETQRESNWVLKTTEEANSLIDPHDGYYLGSYASEFANLYTLIGDQPLSINNLPNQAEELFEVPLYLDASIAGKFDLSWNSNQLPDGWTIELVDLNSGTKIDIKDQHSYSFDHQLKVKASPKSPTDLYTFAFGKSKSVNQPQFMLKVNTGQAVSNEDDLGIPREVELYQNYPNPFNPSSVIRFGVPEQAPVQLEVFDILGRKVMTLLNGDVKQPGRYNINFDGRSLASGMYIYRLVIGNKVLTKKMTLIK